MNELIILTVIIIFLFLIVFWWFGKKIEKAVKPDDNLLKVIQGLQSIPQNLQKNLQDQSRSLQETLAVTNKNISDSIHQSNKLIGERLDTASKYMSEVSKEVGQMSEIGRSMKELQDFLKSPKLRGIIGEQVLKDLIAQMLPKSSFFLQHSFKSGVKVDAALKTSAGILCIDSKFPLENFKKMVKAESKEEKELAKQAFVNDVRKHIRDIADKYILPEEGTLDLALMYIPSEAVYYEVVNIEAISEYARQSRIYPVSPSTLYAHLQMILLSFEGQKIEVKSKQVIALLRSIQKDYQKTQGAMDVLGRHLTNAYNQMSNLSHHFNTIGQKINSDKLLEKGK